MKRTALIVPGLGRVHRVYVPGLGPVRPATKAMSGLARKWVPWGPVKSVENGRTMVQTMIITDAKTKITGTPVKFDPKVMMQQRMQQRQQRQKA